MVGLKINFKVDSHTESIQVVEKRIDEITKAIGVNEDLYGNILIAVTEGVNNAIHHGNRSNPEKAVSIDMEKTDNELIIKILDEGEGFDYNNLPDPTDPVNIEKPHGRGVFLMKNLSDELDFEQEGRLAVLKFKA